MLDDLLVLKAGLSLHIQEEVFKLDYALCVCVYVSVFFHTQNYKPAMTGLVQDSSTREKMRVVYMLNLYRVSK